MPARDAIQSLFVPVVLSYYSLSCPQQVTTFLATPSRQHSVPSPALTDHIISTRRQSLKRHTPPCNPQLSAIQCPPETQSNHFSCPLSFPIVDMKSQPPEPLMMLMMHSWQSITSLASQHPKNHTCSIPFWPQSFSLSPPGSVFGLLNCTSCTHPPTTPILTSFAHPNSSLAYPLAFLKK